MKFAFPDLLRLKQRSYLQGLAIFLLDASGYLLAIAGTIAAPHLRQRIYCAVIAGFFASGLVVVAHDACHQSLTPSRWLNRLLGTLAFLPSLHSYSLWHYGHNLQHHLFTNQRGRDYVWEPISLSEYQSLSWWAKCRYRFFRTFVGHFFYYACEVWWKRRFFPRQQYLGAIKVQYWVDFVIVAAWMAALTMFATTARSSITGQSVHDLQYWFEPLLLSVFLPFTVSSMLSSTSEFLHHTHPSVHWYSASKSENWGDRQSRISVHCQFPAPMDHLMHWIMDHTAHHLQPGIPSYHLQEAQRLVESERQEYVVTYRWSLRAMLNILRDCKLYDDDKGCWTNYSGDPTSASRYERKCNKAA